MRAFNGIEVYEDGDQLPALPPGISSNMPTQSGYGYKIGGTVIAPQWVAASEADYRDAESRRLGIAPEDVKSDFSCFQPKPQECAGQCYAKFCRLAYDPRQQYYYCGCFDN